MTIFDPATNVYAAIAAGPSPEQQAADARARLLARATRAAAIQAIYPPAAEPTPAIRKRAPSFRPRLSRDESAARQQAATDEYAEALPGIHSSYQHARLRAHLAAQYGLSLSTVDRLTLAYREAHKMTIPREVLRRDERRLLHWLRTNTSQSRALPNEAIVTALGMRSGHDLGNLIYRTRKGLQSLADTGARWIIAYDRDRQAFYFDHDLAATYPALMAILEEPQL